MYNISRKCRLIFFMHSRFSVTRHCNYGRPLALPISIDHPAARLPARPGGRKLVSIFTCRTHRPRTHCRFEQRGILSLTLSLRFIRISLLMERTSRVDGSDEKTQCSFASSTFDVYGYIL